MLRSNTKEILKIPLITREDYYAIRVPSDRGKTKAIVITSLTQEEENLLDAGETIMIERGNNKFLIEPKNLCCYGDIDFHSGSEDMDVISDFNWFTYYTDFGFPMPANYDYEEHCCYSTTKRPTYFDTVRSDLVAQYCHAFIGKPSKTVIFKIVL